MWRSAAPVELDFFAMEKQGSSLCKENTTNASTQRSSINDIQKAMARIDPQLLKAMFSRGGLEEKPAAKTKTFSDQELGGCVELPCPTSLPTVKNPIETKEQGKRTPITIFYNGGVSTFEVSPDKAEKIIKLAQEFNVKRVDFPSTTDPSVSDVCSSSDGGEAAKGASFDLPIARRNSLMTFLEKRRERHADSPEKFTEEVLGEEKGKESLNSCSPYTLRRSRDET